MKKYRITPCINIYGDISYSIEKRFLFIFWISEIKLRTPKEKAIDFCNKLNEKIDV